MQPAIKSTTSIFGGYLYQNLVGLELLCDWLDDPALYTWVKFESDDDEVPKGLDDVVAERADGSSVLLQVKFTVDQFNPDHFLTWDWLTARKGRGLSLLQKWVRAFLALGTKRSIEAALITNRLPDREFHSCFLDGSQRLDESRVPKSVLAHLIEDLGTEEGLTHFFEVFEFRHSHQGYLALERTIRDRFVSQHTTHHGWLCLFREAIDWALHKNFPQPDGRIQLHLIRGVLDSHRPRPLLQSFRVPVEYLPPDDEFHRTFVSEITSGERPLVVLWGSPGQGKSTYLSHLCSELESKGIPFIRHHYFLSLSDHDDRFSVASVANSLMSQMEAHHVAHVQGLSERPEKLRDWIEACAMGYATVGKPFVVIVDGLDHVWRENDGNKRPLDRLFELLFPQIPNVVLLLGTQKVSDAQLPAQFTRHVSEEDWLELPRMTLAAIKKWLTGQRSAERFDLRSEIVRSGSDAMAELAGAFEKLSGGHPLLLTYGFEGLVREDRLLSAERVTGAPVQPDGDIKRYYRTLWQRLSFASKDALHLIADAGFIWPPLGLESCLKISMGSLWREIGHLFHLTDAGQVPFHGSLLVSIQSEEGYKERVAQLTPFVVEWLESSAPEFHRWGWLWLYQARTGAPENVVNGPSRSWILSSLANAYPVEQIVKILAAAERIAFEDKRFARAVRLRWLKVRLLNGIEFQIDDFSRLHGCSLALTEDEYPLKVLSAEFYAASIERLYLLASRYLSAGRMAEAVECQEHMRRRINDHLHARAFSSDGLEEALQQYLRIAAATRSYKADALHKTLTGFRRLRRQLFALFLRELGKHGDVRLLMDFVNLPMPAGMRQELELGIIRLAGRCKAEVHNWPEFRRFRTHPISTCWTLLYAPSQARPIAFSAYDTSLDVRGSEEAKNAAETYLHRLFFFGVARCLELKGAEAIDPRPQYKNRAWLTDAASHMLRFANTVGAVLARGEAPAFSLLYRLVASLERPVEYDALTDYIAFRRALLAVSNDMQALCALRTRREDIPTAEWLHVSESPHFVFSEWLERYMAAGLQPLPREVLEGHLLGALQDIASSVSPFNERIGEYLELCELAVAEDLREVASRSLKHSLNCLIGYGWRKDGALAHVLDAITAIAPVDATFAVQAITRVAPIVDRIGDMTEDDATSESDLSELLLMLMPKMFVSYYEHWLLTSNWYTADVVFAALIAKEDLSQPLIPFVTSALWDVRSVAELKDRAASGDSFARSILEDNAQRFGETVDRLGRERFRGTSSPEIESPLIDVRAHGPEGIDDLIEEMTDRKIYADSKETVRRWFEHWRAQGKELQLLQAIEPKLSGESVHWGVGDLFDDCFEISVRLEGKQKAYKWLVAAQVHRHGWDPHFSRSDALERFGVFKAHYPTRWQQFILDTARSPFSTASEKLVIPHHRLVRFLLAVDQSTLAKEVAEEMIATTIEEFSDQPLTKPSWLGSA